MTDFKSELRKILLDLTVKECYGRVEDEDINKVVDDIIALFISRLPKKIKLSTATYQNLGDGNTEERIGYKHGYNDCLADIKRASGIKGELSKETPKSL